MNDDKKLTQQIAEWWSAHPFNYGLAQRYFPKKFKSYIAKKWSWALIVRGEK